MPSPLRADPVRVIPKTVVTATKTRGDPKPKHKRRGDGGSRPSDNTTREGGWWHLLDDSRRARGDGKPSGGREDAVTSTGGDNRGSWLKTFLV